MSVYVGTSGWAYKEWKPDFYPAKLPQSRFLEHYAEHLGACEINATFYRIQAPETFAKWAACTSQGFRFATKAHRALSHAKQIAPDDWRSSLLADYLRSVATLGHRLGVILLQFPAHRERDDEGLARLMEAMTPVTPCAFEFRNESWNDDDVMKAIADAGGTTCVSNTDGGVPDALPPGPIAYVRLRSERYSEEARDGWLELLRREGAERDVYAFTKHEGIPTLDEFGGIGLARWLGHRT